MNLINILRLTPAYIIKYPLNEEGINYLKKNKKNINFYDKYKVGYITGIIQTFLTYPLELLRTRLTLDKKMLNSYNKNIFEYSKYLIKCGGIKNLYTGLNTSLFFYPIYIGFQFSIFGQCKEYGFNSFFSGAITGLIAETIVYPSEIIRRLMMINGINNTTKKYTNMIDCIKKVYIENGIKGFYKSYNLMIVKSVPECAIQFAVYDYFKNLGIKYMEIAI